MQDSEPKKASRWTLRLELWSTILLAIATVMSAWCAYQSTLWSGVQTYRITEGRTASRVAAEKAIIGHQDRLLHIQLFMEYWNAKSAGKVELADFYYKRFPKDLKEAHDEWIAYNLSDPKAPLHPFVIKKYQSRYYEKAAEQEEIAQKKYNEARQANRVSGTYVLCTVLFASVLFFAGVSTRFTLYKIRLTLFIMGCVMFVLAIAALSQLPITTEWGWF